MNYSECLTYLARLGHELRGVKFGLEAITAILASLGDPHKKYRTAIVAGTNGKGSTAAILASILERAGCRTGLYTSPHLVRVNERIRVSGAEIADEDFARAFSLIVTTVDRLLEDRRLEHRPSFFEFLTATAFQHFATARIDFAVLEVGMGGRLDATNVTDPLVAVITNIDLDHQQFLGTTRAAIAGEKVGVIRPRRPVVSTNVLPEAAEVIRRRCAEPDSRRGLLPGPHLSPARQVSGGKRRGGGVRRLAALSGGREDSALGHRRRPARGALARPAGGGGAPAAGGARRRAQSRRRAGSCRVRERAPGGPASAAGLRLHAR
ncbi:MAG: hypothetical protein HYS61_02840 [Acidobacteria bacterium]|nr:hypothetical protein [Acidobacteriota bacterium]